MAVGMMVYNASGAELFYTLNVKGGVIAGIYDYAAASSGTLTFPDYAGRTGYVHFLECPVDGGGVVVDHALGYPRYTISTATVDKRVFLAMMV
jgi:hypothetical protein